MVKGKEGNKLCAKKERKERIRVEGRSGRKKGRREKGEKESVSAKKKGRKEGHKESW